MLLSSIKSSTSSVLELVTVLLIFVLILAATYFVTRWIGGYQKTKTGNKNIQLLEAVRLPSNKYIELVRVGKDKYIVVGVGKEEINVLAELTEEELMPDISANSIGKKTSTKSFSDILGGFKDSLPKSKDNE